MHLFFCSTVLLFAMPGSERLLPYKAFRVPGYLRKEKLNAKSQSRKVYFGPRKTLWTRKYFVYSVYFVFRKNRTTDFLDLRDVNHERKR